MRSGRNICCRSSPDPFEAGDGRVHRHETFGRLAHFPLVPSKAKCMTKLVPVVLAMIPLLAVVGACVAVP
jgi:hypothetical protein